VREFFISKVKNPSVFACLVPEIKNFGEVFIPISNAFHAGLALYKQLFPCLISIFLLDYISLIFNFVPGFGGFFGLWGFFLRTQKWDDAFMSVQKY